MPHAPSLAATEKRVFHASWQDGLLDIIAGITVALIGTGGLLGVLTSTLGLPIVGIIAWHTARRKITQPRLGFVVFSTRRRHDLRHGLVAILSLGVVVGGFLVTRIWQAHSPFAEWFAPAIPATILATLALSCAAALNLWRFVAYGLIFAAAGLGAAATRIEPWWCLVVGGVAIATWGVFMLIGFLREFPKLSNEVQD